MCVVPQWFAFIEVKEKNTVNVRNTHRKHKHDDYLLHPISEAIPFSKLNIFPFTYSMKNGKVIFFYHNIFHVQKIGKQIKIVFPLQQTHFVCVCIICILSTLVQFFFYIFVWWLVGCFAFHFLLAVYIFATKQSIFIETPHIFFFRGFCMYISFIHSSLVENDRFNHDKSYSILCILVVVGLCLSYLFGGINTFSSLSVEKWIFLLSVCARCIFWLKKK